MQHKETAGSAGQEAPVIRLLREEDLSETLRWRNLEENRRWFLNTELLKWESHLAWYKNNLNSDSDFVYVVTQGDTLVAQCSIYNIDKKKMTAEVGRFITNPDFRGRGYASWALKQLIQFAKTNWNLRSLYLVVKSENKIAIDIYRNHGFESEGDASEILKMFKIL